MLAKVLTAFLALQGGVSQKPNNLKLYDVQKSQTYDGLLVDARCGLAYFEKNGKPVTYLCQFHPEIPPLELVPANSGPNPRESYDMVHFEFGQTAPAQTVGFIANHDIDHPKTVAAFKENITRFAFAPVTDRSKNNRAPIRRLKNNERLTNITRWGVDFSENKALALYDHTLNERIEACKFESEFNDYGIVPISAVGKYHYDLLAYYTGFGKDKDFILAIDQYGSGKEPEAYTELAPGLPHYILRQRNEDLRAQKTEQRLKSHEQFVSKFQNRNNKK